MARLRLLLCVLVTLMLLPVALGGLAVGLLYLAPFDRWLAHQLEARIRLEGLSAGWPLTVRADRLTLLDRQGAWLSASGLRVEMSIEELGWLRIRRLSAATVTVDRRPSGEGGGSAGFPWLPLTISVDRLDIPDLRLGRDLRGSLSAALRLDGRRLSVSLSLAGRPAPTAERIDLAVVGGADLASGTIDIGRLRLARDGDRLSASGRLQAWGRSLGLVFMAQPGNASLSGLAGRMAVFGAIGGSLAKPCLAVSARLPPGITGNAAVDHLLGPSPRLRASLAVGGEDDSALAQVRLDGQGGGFAFGGRLGPSLLAGGRWHFQGKLPLAGELLAVVGKAVDQPQGVVALVVRGANREARAGFAFRWGTVVRFEDIDLSSGDGVLTGALGWDRAANRFTGRLGGRIAELAAWRAESGGSLGFDVTLSPAGGQSAELLLEGAGLHWAGVRLAHLGGRASATGLLVRPRLDARLSLSQLSLGRLRAGQVQVQATGPPDDLALRLAGAGMQAEGLARPGHYRLSALRLALGSSAISLLAPAELAEADGVWSLARLALALDGGRVVASGRLAGGVIDGGVTMTSMPLAPLAAVLPDWQPSGLLSGRLAVEGRLDAPQVSGLLKAVNLDVGSHRAGIEATIAADWNGRRLDGRATARGLNGAEFAIQGSLPLEIADGHPVMTEGPLSGHVDGHGDLGRIAELLPLGDQAVGGAVTMDLRLGGTTASPELSGAVRLTGGSYRNFDTGTNLADISLAAGIGEGHRLRLSGRGTDGGDGRFSLDGDADLAAGQAKVAARLDKLAVVRLDLLQGKASGDLSLTRDGGPMAVSGHLTVDDGEVDIGQLLPSGIVPLKVIEVNGGAPPTVPPSSKGGADLPLDVDLEIALPVLDMHGKGLDSRWKGQLHLAGPPARPIINGRLSLVRGSYTLFGKPLQLTAGTVTFDGEQPPDPRLDATASGQTPGVTVVVRLTGTVKKPDFAFTSDPPLPKDEVLAHLLFGDSAGQMSVLQQISLARAAASRLTGEGEGFDPLDRLRGFLGLDMLQAGGDVSTPLGAPGMPDLAAAATGTPGQQLAAGQPGSPVKSSGPSLSLGKYLTSRTYLRVDQGTSGGRVTVEEDLGQGFAVDTRLGEGTGGGIGFSWKLDY